MSFHLMKTSEQVLLALDLLIMINGGEPVTRYELARAMHRPVSTVNYHLNNLVIDGRVNEFKILHEDKDGYWCQFAPAVGVDND